MVHSQDMKFFIINHQYVLMIKHLFVITIEMWSKYVNSNTIGRPSWQILLLKSRHNSLHLAVTTHDTKAYHNRKYCKIWPKMAREENDKWRTSLHLSYYKMCFRYMFYVKLVTLCYTHTMMKTAPMLVSFGTRPAPPWRLFSRLSSPMSLMSNLSASRAVSWAESWDPSQSTWL